MSGVALSKSGNVHLTLILRISVEIASHDAICRTKKFAKMHSEILLLKTLCVDATPFLRYIFLGKYMQAILLKIMEAVDMPKTKNAFAFRDFNSTRILQRPFFKNFYFEPDKSDDEILKSFNTATEDFVDIWERRLYEIKAILDRLTEFRHLIDRHNELRLDKYNKKKSMFENVKITELKHPAPVMEYFSASLSVAELINKFKTLYCRIDKNIQARYRKEFGNRLKRIRKDLGLSQRQLGSLIQVSPEVFSLYERGERRDLPIHMIIRLAKALDMSTDKLLGFK